MMSGNKPRFSLKRRFFSWMVWILFGLFSVVGLHIQSPAFSQDSHLGVELERQGQTLYQVGDFEAAAEVWKTIIETESDDLTRIMAWGNLSLCLQKLGKWQDAQQAIQESLDQLKFYSNSNQADILTLSAQVFSIQGHLFFSLGEYAQALEHWETAENQYQQINHQEGIFQSQLNQAQALQELGLYRRAEQQLIDLQQELTLQPNSPLKIAQFRHLSHVLRILGKLGNLENLDVDSYDVSQPSASATLNQALEIAKQLQLKEEIRKTEFSLANTARALYHREQELDNSSTAQRLAHTALDYYSSAIHSSSLSIQVKARLNRLSLLIESQLNSEPENWKNIEQQINRLPLGRTAVYAKIDLAQSLIKLGHSEAQPLLLSAVQQAEQLGDSRIQSYALGYLGKFYEQLQDGSRAQHYTQNALLLSQSIQADEISYQWQWQLGRILKSQHPSNPEIAISAYQQAIETLQSLRQDLVAIRQDVQFDFRDQVEPVYREFVDLLLQPQTPSIENLKQAREVIENLQLAELDNFFHDACLKAQPQPIDQIDPNAIVIYGIILSDRLEMIASASQEQLFHYRTRISKSELIQTLEDLRKQLQQPYIYSDIQQLSYKVYRWLVEPIQTQLNGNETLVFVLDDELRNIPLSALYDGNKYLIEQHPVVVQPGLQLLDPQPILQPLNILSAGLVDPPAGFPEFPPLPNVPQELQQIQAVSVNSEQLIDEEFNQDNLEKKVSDKSFQVVHLATHGQFSSQSEKTFILAADGPINIQQLDQIISRQEQMIDLLVLSACETAPGDNRAVLGLAGMAVRAGARSTIGSLWSLNDESAVEFMRHFYQALVKGKSRAEALRQAQLMFLKDRDRHDAPRYWASYVLVGSWQ